MRPSRFAHPALIALALPALGFGNCTTGTDPDAPDWEPEADWDGGAPDLGPAVDPTMCLAIHGNGPRLTAHASATARLVEHYGLFEAVAGGSSGSVTSFIIQSVQDNPHVYDCGGAACSEGEKRSRAALLLKSLHGYIEVLAMTEEASAAQTVAEVVRRVQEQGVPGLLRTSPSEGVSALITVLSDPDIRGFVNPDVFTMLVESPDRVRLARDLVEITAKGVSFQVEDERFFLMPGLVDMEFITNRIGRVGGFYAADAPVLGDAMADFLDVCSDVAWGLDWTEIRRIPSGIGEATCGQMFDGLVADTLLALADAPFTPNRIDYSVSDDTTPALVGTSVLQGAAAEAFHTAQDAYLGQGDWTFAPSFDDIGFGWFGGASDLTALQSVPDRGDARSSRFVPLGDAPWRVAMRASITEPGLGAGVRLDDGSVSVGGWGDPTPTIVLEERGCEQVVLLTRPGGAGWFPETISELLGMSDDQRTALYAIDDPESSHTAALYAADAVVCSDWDTPPVTDLPAMFDVGYDAPMETTEEFFTAGPTPYGGIKAPLDIPGCTPLTAPEEEPPASPTISCGDVVTGDTTVDAAATHRFDAYSCNVGNYTAPERTFAFHAERSGTVEWGLVDARPSELDHDVIVMPMDGEGDCLTWGPNSVEFEVEAGRSYLLIVDGFDDAAGAFTAELTCGE